MIKKETIQKATNFLNEINYLILSKKRFLSNEMENIAKKHNIHKALFYSAVNCNYFTRTSMGVYKSNLDYFHPIHARNVIESQNKYFSEKKKSRKKEVK